jgi:NADH dehydrogenase
MPLGQFPRIFAGKRMQYVLDTVTQIDFETKKVHWDTGTYEYVICGDWFGAELILRDTGVQENSYTLWSFECS